MKKISKAKREKRFMWTGGYISLVIADSAVIKLLKRPKIFLQRLILLVLDFSELCKFLRRYFDCPSGHQPGDGLITPWSGQRTLVAEEFEVACFDDITKRENILTFYVRRFGFDDSRQQWDEGVEGGARLVIDLLNNVLAFTWREND